MLMREIMTIVEGAEIGHNGGPEPVTLTLDGKTMGQKVYRVEAGGRRLGYAYAKYKAPKPGYAGGTTFSMDLRGKSFTGSRANLLKWLEKMASSDI